MKRLILDRIPSGMQHIQGVAYDGVLDIITDQEAPADALYVAEQAPDSQITVVKDSTTGRNLTKHTFAGWPETLDSKRIDPPAGAKAVK